MADFSTYRSPETLIHNCLCLLYLLVCVCVCIYLYIKVSRFKTYPLCRSLRLGRKPFSVSSQKHFHSYYCCVIISVSSELVVSFGDVFPVELFAVHFAGDTRPTSPLVVMMHR